jgi:hypothetical protein
MNSLHHQQQQQQKQQQQTQTQQQQQTQTNQTEQQHNWIHRHRAHHSLDSTTTTTTTTHHHLINHHPQPTPSSPTNHNKFTTKRSLSLSASQSASNKLSPTHHHPIQSITIEPTNFHQQQQTQKTSKSKPSLVSAIPAAILKKDKPGLLSQEQKRANHIASEQKVSHIFFQTKK